MPCLTSTSWHITIATNETQIVAQTVQLPSKIELYRHDLVWTSGLAEYFGWGAGLLEPAPVLRVTEPAKYAGLTQRVMKEYLPEEITSKVPLKGLRPFSDKVRQDRHRHPIPIEILISDMPDGTRTHNQWEAPARRVNGWQMRDDFLHLDRSSASLLSFLNKYGEWGENTSPTLQHSPDRMEPHIVIPDEIWNVHDRREPNSMQVPPKPQSVLPLQDVIRWGLSGSPARWFKSEYGSVTPSGPRPEFPHFVITAECCHDVILTTITIDHLRGTKFRTCARFDCGTIFALESQHKRNYCCQYCAHLESVRRNRRRTLEE